jgi:hypothetical protein
MKGKENVKFTQLFLHWDTRVLSLRIKRLEREVYHLTISTSEIKNAWRLMSPSLYVFMVLVIGWQQQYSSLCKV